MYKGISLQQCRPLVYYNTYPGHINLVFFYSTEHYDFVVQMLYNLVYVQALTYVICQFTGDERQAWRRTGFQVCVA